MIDSRHRLYTVICEFRGGAYISQVSAVDEQDAVLEWSERIAKEKPIHRASKHLARRALLEPASGGPPVRLDGLTGAWCMTSSIGKDLVLWTLVLSDASNGVDPPDSLQMKNIQVIDGAENANFSIFQATDEEFSAIFPADLDMELMEDFITRVGGERAVAVLEPIWNRPVLKRHAQGIHGSLFCNWGQRRQYIPTTKREVDLEPLSINAAQRTLFEAYRSALPRSRNGTELREP